MSAHLLFHRDPFKPYYNTKPVEIPLFITIHEILVREGHLVLENDTGNYRRAAHFVVTLNGKPILQADWNLVIGDEDLLQIIYIPRGGGGSNISNIIAAIAIAVMAYFTFGLSVAASAAVGVAAYAGLTLLTGLVPKPSTSLGATSREATSPTYSLNAQGNNARLLEAAPRIYGRVRMYPDLASQPYTEYQGNQQYLYQLFCVSVGQVSIEQILIDETPIGQFEDATYQVIEPGQAVTLFPDNVVTSDAVSQLTMLGPNNPSYSVLGPYVASPAGTTSNFIGIDIALPSGAGRTDDNGNTQASSVSFNFEAQPVDDTGAPIGNWFAIVSETISYATNQAQILSYKVEVAPGRYQVRGYRSTNDPSDNRTWNTLQWLALRAYLNSTFVYPDVTLLAVVMKATNALNSSTARKFSVVATGKVPIWDPVNGWSSPQATRNPAWAAADILRNTVYGRSMATSGFNVQKLYSLSQTWATRGDTFNYVFDTTVTLWDALSKALRVGRAVPIYYAGAIDFIRDEPQTIAQAMFQPANIIAGSFKSTYQFMAVDSPDCVQIEYVDETTWSTKTVTSNLAGGTQLKPYKTELPGCTSRDQAYREAMSMAASNRDRRRTITFSADTPGLVPTFNSLARISHDLPIWGYSGRVISLDRATGILRSTEPIPFADSSPHFIAFRARDGGEDGPYSIVRDDTLIDGDEIYGCKVVATSTQLANIYISDGIKEDFTFYQAGPSERRGIKVLVRKAMPNENGQVDITCINYADSVYTAETGGVTPAPGPESNLPSTPSMPIVDTVNVVYTFQVGVQNIIASAARGAIYYEFRAKLSGTSQYANLGTNSEPTLVVNLSPGVWEVQVRAIGRAVGPWATWTGTIEATTLPAAKLDVFTASEKLWAVGLNWAYNAESLTIAAKVEIRVGVTNVLGDSSLLVSLPYPANAYDHTNLNPLTDYFYWARVIDTAGRVGPWFNGGVPITAHASRDADLILEQLNGEITESQLGQALIDKIDSGGGAAIEIQEVKTDLAAMYTIKTQLTSGGVPYMAGIGVGVENNQGIITSQILLAAARVAILDESSGSVKTPFVVQGGIVYMNAAMIADASITNAKIGNVIQSDALGAGGQPRWKLDKSGSLTLTGPNSGGYLRITDSQVAVYDGSGVLRVRLGIW